MQFEQSEITLRTAKQMSSFADELALSYVALRGGQVFDEKLRLPHFVVGEALDAYGGILCPLLWSYIHHSPSEIDLPFLEAIRLALERVYEIAEDVAKRLKMLARSGHSYVKRFSISPHRLFALGYIDRVTAHAPVTSRERLMVRCSKAVRGFLEWLRSAFVLLETRIVKDPFRAFELTPYARSVVDQMDRQRGFIILKASPRIGSLPFHILPTSEMAWNIIRMLCEKGDRDGYVKLPPNYASAFHHTDKNNESIDDDYAKLLRHIVPGLKTGTYRLELGEKPRLLRDS